MPMMAVPSISSVTCGISDCTSSQQVALTVQVTRCVMHHCYIGDVFGQVLDLEEDGWKVGFNLQVEGLLVSKTVLN